MDGNGTIELGKMKRGQKGIVKAINGGINLRKKLEDIGLRIGKEVIKVCNQPLSGPVQIRIGNIEVAIGHRMAKKILISVKDSISCD